MPSKGKIKDIIGEIHTTNQGYPVEIIASSGSRNITVKFLNGVIITGLHYSNVKKGYVKNPYHPTVHGVGYLGQGNYNPMGKNNKKSKTYQHWASLLERAYCKKHARRHPTYKECSVAPEWHNFQNFAKWFDENYKLEYMQKWQLDKDLFSGISKVYSPETCCFIPSKINILIVKNVNKNGLPQGIRKSKNGRKFEVQLQVNNKQIHLGSFDNIIEAFECYKFHKVKHIKEVADEYREAVGEKVYQALINYKIEITD